MHALYAESLQSHGRFSFCEADLEILALMKMAAALGVQENAGAVRQEGGPPLAFAPLAC